MDATVQEKAVASPTDARLYHRMLEKLVKQAKKYGVSLRQSYLRVAKKALVMPGRYFHARQAKRARREVKRLKTWLGRTTRDIDRKISGNAALREVFIELLQLSRAFSNRKGMTKTSCTACMLPKWNA